MRHLLISVAALALTAGTALAQPDHDRGRGPEHRQDVGKASMGGQVQQRAQAELRGQDAPIPQRTAQGGGGPTSFTNQIQGQQPGPNGERPDRGNQERGNWQGRQQGAPQQAVAPQQQQENRGNWQGRQQGAPQQAVAPQQQPDQNRGNWQGGRDRGDRNGGNWQGRDDNRRDFNRGRDNDYRGGYNDYRSGYNGNRGGYNGPRRDFRSYSNYHRDWRPTRRFRAPVYHRPPGWYSARWTFGQILPSLFWSRDYWLDYRVYDLPAPPYGAVWVRVGNDALMIDDYSGEIITVAYSVFY